jgi:hypothetical protein
MLPECIKNFEEVAPTARQIALYFASAELWGCLLQPQCIIIVEHCLNLFLLTSHQTDLVPQFCNFLTLYGLSVFYLTKLSDDPGSAHDGMLNSIFGIGD